MNVGIDNAKATHCNRNIYEYGDKCYALYPEHQPIKQYLKNTMMKHMKIFLLCHLDSKISTLSYQWEDGDNKNECRAYGNIAREDGLSYRLAITLFQSEVIVEIIL